MHVHMHVRTHIILYRVDKHLVSRTLVIENLAPHRALCFFLIVAPEFRLSELRLDYRQTIHTNRYDSRRELHSLLPFSLGVNNAAAFA